MYLKFNTEVSRSSETPLYVKKEQKINDRLQDKINILKTQAHLQETRQPLHAKDTLNRSKESAKDISQGRKIKETEILKREKESKKEAVLNDEGKDSRVLRNNWIISNQVLKETGLKS